MAAPYLLLVLLISAMAGHSSATWCVCKEGGDAALQKTLDYACGAGADCNPIHQNGPCWNPNSVRAHCSYAVNSFYQRKGQAQGTCDFSGTATITTTDPSSSGCVYPASASATGTSTGTGTGTSTGTTPVSTTTPSSTTSGTTSPYNTGTTPSTGVLGGIGTGMGPSGMNTDLSHGGLRLQDAKLVSFSTVLLFLGLMLTMM